MSPRTTTCVKCYHPFRKTQKGHTPSKSVLGRMTYADRVKLPILRPEIKGILKHARVDRVCRPCHEDYTKKEFRCQSRHSLMAANEQKQAWERFMEVSG